LPCLLFHGRAVPIYRSISFTIIFPGATGLMLKAMDTAGSRTWRRAIQTGARTQTDTGLIQITVGHGLVTRISAGPRIIMVAGRISPTTAGFGSPEATWTGDRPGFRGEPGAITSAGRRCRHGVRALFMKDNLSARTSMSCTISARNITISATCGSSASRCCGIGFFRRCRTSPTSQTR